MKSSVTKETGDRDSMKWGYAFAGACALGFAALIHVAFGGLDEESLANLPAIVTVPYGIAGKLGITVPLAVLGVGLILRDVLVNQRTGSTALGATASARSNRTAGIHPPKSATAPSAAEDLEMGEPLADELPALPKPAKKIAALAGGFGGRGGGHTEATGGPLGDSEPVSERAGNGQIVLSSAKYLNRNPGGSFRRGSTNHTKDE